MPSQLCVYDLGAEQVRLVMVTDRLIEAPNWDAGVSALIVNAEGRLFRVPLGAPALDPIETGFAQQLNNDHGISPDGRTLVISDQTETDGSCLYTLPIYGGTPQRITENTPSWWHGWSPDGETLAYTARRNGIFDIYTCSAKGGPETRLTEGFEHTDGPDYTPNGKWIWFNGQRDGIMNLWRMRTDGAKLQQMTGDAAQNWFPHPSPDGKWVLYVAYAPGTEGHPRDLPVELRLMPAGGGPYQTLVSLTGGQGTINVPCWSPDSKRFAFVQTV